MNVLRFGDDVHEEATGALKQLSLQDKNSKPLAAEPPSAVNNGRTVKILGGRQIARTSPLENLKSKFGVVGQELADALPLFSHDLVGLVAEYFFSRPSSPEDLSWILSKTIGIPPGMLVITRIYYVNTESDSMDFTKTLPRRD
jgi:hypothetical protein